MHLIIVPDPDTQHIFYILGMGDLQNTINSIKNSGGIISMPILFNMSEYMPDGDSRMIMTIGGML